MYFWTDPWNYILQDKEAEKKWDFSLRKSLNRSNRNKLLEGYSFQLVVNNAADVLKGNAYLFCFETFKFRLKEPWPYRHSIS